MPEPKRKAKEETNLELDGFETFFEATPEKDKAFGATVSGEQITHWQIEKLLERFSQLITLTTDQKVETATLGNQLVDNQKQLIATQQILIRLMDKSIELTRYITSIEEKLPALYELPRIVEALRARVAQLEGFELDKY